MAHSGRMPVLLDMGHTGRTGGRAGAVFGDFREVEVVRAYCFEAARLLEGAGVAVELLGHGSYATRQGYARRAGGRAFVACHINSGWREGYRGAAFHTPNALGGTRLAECLADQIEELTGSSRVWETSHEGWLAAAHSLMVHTGRVPATVFEPVFIDCHAHRPLLEEPKRIGRALSQGVLNFLESSR